MIFNLPAADKCAWFSYAYHTNYLVKKLLDFCALNLTIFLGKMELMIFEINCGPAKIGDIGRWA